MSAGSDKYIFSLRKHIQVQAYEEGLYFTIFARSVQE